MASLPPSLRNTLSYFAKYDYPLTADELYFWQHGTRISKGKIKIPKQDFKIRRQREKYSNAKWLIARNVGEQLKKFPTILAVFVTGALAMNNCPPNDDIDIMIVTYPNCLWFTRFFVVLYLKLSDLRRHPASAIRSPITDNRICDNLWLDIKNLKLKIKNLRVAHEVLQAKILWDRAGIYSQFLRSNSWVKNYLPVAYKYLTLGPSPEFRRGKPRQGEVFLKLLNLLFFTAQYLYMKPKMTSERVGLGFAFFHPSNTKELRI